NPGRRRVGAGQVGARPGLSAPAAGRVSDFTFWPDTTTGGAVTPCAARSAFRYPPGTAGEPRLRCAWSVLVVHVTRTHGTAQREPERQRDGGRTDRRDARRPRVLHVPAHLGQTRGLYRMPDHERRAWRLRVRICL